MIRRLVAYVAIVLLASCATGGQSTDSNPPTPSVTSIEDWNLDTQTLVDRAESLRDRDFSQPPSFVVERADGQHAAPALSRSAIRQSWHIASFLFGFGDAITDPDQLDRPHLVPSSPTYGRAAHYRPDRHVVQLDPTSDLSPEQMRREVLFALTVALDREHHPTIDVTEADHWDAALARIAATTGLATFVETTDILSGRDVDDPRHELADYPELYDQLRASADTSGETDAPTSSTESLDTIDDPDSLRRRLQRFLTRQSFALTAALQRANGWSAAELVFSSPPTSTADVVRPDRWIDGAPTADWTWPDAKGDTVEHGAVGPATIAVWLEQLVTARAAATLFNGYETDQFRLVDDADTDATRFEWVTMWKTPGGARQVAAAFDRVLRHSTRDGYHHSVLQGGLKVATVISTAPLEERTPPSQTGTTSTQSKPDVSTAADAGTPTSDSPPADAGTLQKTTGSGERAIDQFARHLLNATAQFNPRDGLPIAFVPTRRDSFRRHASAAKFDGQDWVDPTGDLRIELSPLSEWNFQATDSLPLRWVARSPGGAILQWSTTLQTPLDPAFNTDAYRSQLASRLSSTAEISRDAIEFTDSDLAPLTATVSPPGAADSSDSETDPQTLIWQYRCRDTVHAISLGLADSSSIDRDRENVRNLLAAATDESGELKSCSARQDSTKTDSDTDQGSIDVEIHGE